MGCAFSENSKDQNNPKVDSNRRNRLSTIDCRRLSTKVVDMIIENIQILSEKLTEAQIQYCVKALADHTLFSGLSHDELKALCAQMVWVSAKKD